MLQILLLAVFAAPEPAADASIRQVPTEYLISEVMKLSSGDASEDLKKFAADLKELAEQKQQLRGLLEQMFREQRRLSAAGSVGSPAVIDRNASRPERRNPALARQQQYWAQTLPQLCPPGTERGGCIELQLKARLATLAGTPSPK